MTKHPVKASIYDITLLGLHCDQVLYKHGLLAIYDTFEGLDKDLVDAYSLMMLILMVLSLFEGRPIKDTN